MCTDDQCVAAPVRTVIEYKRDRWLDECTARSLRLTGYAALAVVGIAIAFWSVPLAIEAHHQQVLIAQESYHHG